jgi:hypothetical protein
VTFAELETSGTLQQAQLAECPLRSESDRIAASPRIDATGQQQTSMILFVCGQFKHPSLSADRVRDPNVTGLSAQIEQVLQHCG